MIFIFIIVVLDSLIRIFKIFLEVFHPFSNDSQNSIRFYKENSIIDFFLCIKHGILWYFSTYNIFGVSFDFFSVLEFFMSKSSFFCIIFSLLEFSSSMNRKEYLFKGLSHITKESFVLLATFVDHKIDHSHDLISIISTFSVSNY